VGGHAKKSQKEFVAASEAFRELLATSKYGYEFNPLAKLNFIP
jgi:hypothetical protein